MTFPHHPNYELCTMNYSLLLPLAATIIIELLVLLALKEKRKKVLLASVVVNILTNVPLNIYVIATEPDLSYILLAELLVVIIETLWYYVFVRDLRQAAIYSFLCNAISFLLGVLADILLLILPV